MADKQTNALRPFGMRDKIGYALGDFGCNMSFSFISNYMITFFVICMKLDPIVCGMLIFIGKVFDAINDPIVGGLVDASKGGKEGKLGVEGMTPEVLLQALRNAGAELDGESVSASSEPVTKADLYALRLSGHADSASRRKTLQKELGLPEHLSANALLQAINLLFTRSEFLAQYKIDHDCQAE